MLLKPCPFCGSNEIDLDITLQDDNDRCPRPHRVYEVQCLGCDAIMTQWSPDWKGSETDFQGAPETDNDLAAKEAVIGRWNRRV